MARIEWCGNQPWEKDYPEGPIPAEKHRVALPGSVFLRSIPYAGLPALLCGGVILLKMCRLDGQRPNLAVVPLGILLGLLLLPIHECLHALCFQRGQTVYIGVCLERFAAFAVCHEPISRRRFVVMSLAPVLLGLLPMLLFLLLPSTPLLSGLLIPLMVMGWFSPLPDYRAVYQILRQTTQRAIIQSQNSGIYWYSEP